VAMSRNAPPAGGNFGTMKIDSTWGSAAGQPFECPGGLFATAKNLWINDESYGEAGPVSCGANDAAGNAGGVLAASIAQTTTGNPAFEPTNPATIIRFANYTSRPGFGGIFVENDQ
jgi:hypothetical protein